MKNQSSYFHHLKTWYKRVHAHPIFNTSPITIRWLLAASLLTLAIYLWLAWQVLPPAAVWSPDEGAKLLQMFSLRTQGGELAFDIPYAGRNLDPELDYALAGDPRDVLAVINDRLVLQRLPVFPILSRPLYDLLGLKGIYILPALGGVLTCLLALLLVPRQDRRPGMWLLIAFASPVFIYSTIYWEHTLAAGLFIGGVWLCLAAIGRRWRGWQAAPAWCGTALLFVIGIYLRLEISIYVAGLFFAAWFVAPQQRRWLVLAGGIVFLGLLAYWPLHAWLFSGRVGPANAAYLIRPLAYLRGAEWRAVTDLLVGPAEEEGLHPGWIGGLWSLAAVVAAAHSFTPAANQTAQRLRQAGLGICALSAAWFLFSPQAFRSAHGLLLTTPWAILGLTRAREVWETTAEDDPPGAVQRRQLLVATALMGLLFYAIFMLGMRGSSPQGGLEWGARFALPLYALLALIAAWDWSDLPRLDRILLVLLVALGVGFQLRGLATLRSDKITNAALNQAILETPELHVVSDLWWLSLNAAPLYDPHAPPPQVAFYAAATPQKIVEWVELAYDQQITHFDLVTLDNALPGKLVPLLPERRWSFLGVEQVDNLLIFRLAIH